MKNAFKALQLTHSYLRNCAHDKVIVSKVRRRWAEDVLRVLDFEIALTSATSINGPVIFVANHISYIDIPLLMATLDDCVFVSKKAVAYWPMFGDAAKKIGTVFVNRASRDSRSQAKQEIERQLSENKRRIVVFPSGTTSISNEASWRKGVFEIAQKLNLPVQPVRINYSRLREVAYIGSDFFPVHLLKLSQQRAIKAEVNVHKPFLVANPLAAAEYCRTWCNSPIKLNRTLT
jgi:1-acyl-sn-glycerol-3-phosphate acyltransferase